jgi:hypothetical protein
LPTSVAEIFSRVSLSIKGRVRWGGKILDDRPGVYVVSLASNPDDINNKYGDKAPIGIEIIQKWISTVPTLTMDGKRPNPNELKNRLAGFWFRDETILYIGKAGTSLHTRVGQYYQTPLGDKRPHAGGHWLKTLFVLSDLYIHWAITNMPEEEEFKMLSSYIENVSKISRENMADPQRPFPFANLEFPKGNRKDHGIKRSVNR